MKLTAVNLVKKYKGKAVVNNVSIEVNQGEIVGMLGPNGAGKTTTFYMVVGLVKPNTGKVLLGDEDITKLPVYKRARKGIGYLAQDESVFRGLTVEENIRAVLQMTKLSVAQQREKVDELIDEFNLHKVRKSPGKVLSGGERRRTEIARTLAVDPKFVLLDEPFAGVDPLAVEEIQNIIYHLKHKNIGILITDHNADAILSITDRSYVMSLGKRFADGPPEELVQNPLVKEHYLGKNYVLVRKFIKEDVKLDAEPGQINAKYKDKAPIPDEYISKGNDPALKKPEMMGKNDQVPSPSESINAKDEAAESKSQSNDTNDSEEKVQP
ncbi:ABC transporter ATP-binding protein [Microscilla marina ATCC 23134]|uniref:ABC transporter ATP-binding protein n=1 Tax=Microscilla marina ATCC 23134 TaxID=313606 RepID=A1ZYM1_MICM2|nr:ABC transporter ATP-binding protein [Microscilla marina ATCC 23134]